MHAFHNAKEKSVTYNIIPVIGHSPKKLNPNKLINHGVIYLCMQKKEN